MMYMKRVVRWSTAIVVVYIVILQIGIPFGWMPAGRTASDTVIRYFELLAQDDPELVYPLGVPPEHGGLTLDELAGWMELAKWGDEEIHVQSVRLIPVLGDPYVLVRLRFDYSNGESQEATVRVGKVKDEWKIGTMIFFDSYPTPE